MPANLPKDSDSSDRLPLKVNCGLESSIGSIGGEYNSVLEVVQSCSPKELIQCQTRLDRAIEELGLQFSDTGGRRSRSNPWRLDLFPQVLTKEVWGEIVEGVVQRALAFNAYATDLYGEQRILKERIIPHELALRDPAFHRQLSGIEVPNGEYSQFGAFDLIQTQEEEWRIVEHHMGTPFGLSHVLQNRRILSQAFPELYEHVDVAPVAGFSTFLLEMLRAQSPLLNPHIVLLTTGRPGQAYFEEAFIARHMGLSIAQPGDLLVRESRVFLKTIRGLEPIDVIYRRIESAALDPISVPEGGAMGVPGLMSVWRKGNVSIVNAPGVGVADNRSLLRYDERIISFYLNQSTRIPSVETYHLSDVDQRSYVAENMDRFVLKPVQDHDVLWRRCGNLRPKESSKAIERIARKYPEYFVAQAIPESKLLPRLKDGCFESEGVSLRVFYILGKEPIVLPGGLARHGAARHRTRRLTLASEGLKDVLIPEKAVSKVEPRRSPTSVGDRFSIGSRVAESLYWSGRYLERAENTARQFNTLEKLRWDQMARSEQRTYWPLLQAVAAATGQVQVAKRKKPPADTFPLSRSLLLDAKEGASVRACIGYARDALESVREAISPECREVLEEIILDLNVKAKGRINRTKLRVLGETIVSEIARFNGTAERTMPHDDSWQFYRIGIFVERALGTLLLLEVALPKIVETYRATDEENADLTALLRLLGSLDAYRRTFRSRAYVDRVAQLIIQGNYNPSSVSFCLRNLRYGIGTLSITNRSDGMIGGEGELIKQIDQLAGMLEKFSLSSEKRSFPEMIDLERIPRRSQLPFSAEQVEAELKELAEAVGSLHERIEDLFFSHQEIFARNPTLFDIG